MVELTPRRRPGRSWPSDAGRLEPGQAHYGAGPLGGPETPLPPSVRRASRLLAVSAGVTVLGGAFVLGMVSLTPIGLLLGLLVLAYGAFEARVASLLRAFVGWARSAAFVVAGVDALLAVAGAPAGGLDATDGIALAIALALRVGIVVSLLRPDARAAFDRHARDGKAEEARGPRP